MAQHNRAALDAMNKNSDESGKDRAKGGDTDDSNKSDEKKNSAEETQVSD